MLRLLNVGAVATAVASAALPRARRPSGASSLPCVCVTMKTASVCLPVTRSTALASGLVSQHQFRVPSSNTRTSPLSVGATPTPTFLRGARLFTLSPLSRHAMQYRWIRVKGQDKGHRQHDGSAEGTGKEGEESKSKTESGNDDGDQQRGSSAKGNKNGRKREAKKKSFMDHIRGVRDDYANFPHIYNIVNAINFVIFTAFCLCSTGSNTEERWWLEKWGVDNSPHPWTWLLHSFLTNNFLAMTFAMMLLHTMCHHLLPILGSRGLTVYCGSTAVISGVMMFLGNYLYYGSTASPEKQFGPWDIVAGLFVMEYLYYGLTPMTILSSFSGWIKYACWVGATCILYFDWQPTLVGTLVGLALCKGVPRFKAVKPTAKVA